MKKRMANLPVYQIARELVALLGVVELILATYIGYQFGSQQTYKAWLFTGILAVIAYSSTRLWIWCLEKMTHGEHRGI